MAANNFPTMFMEYDWDKVTSWAGDGALAAFDVNKFAQTAPTWFAKTGGKQRFDAYKIAGEYVFAPAYRPNVGIWSGWVVFYRKDWYRRVGLELPSNWEEYVRAIKTFYDRGFTGGRAILPKNPFVKNWVITGDFKFPRDEEEWVMHHGNTIAPFATEAAYWALKRDNYMYNIQGGGLISREFELSTVTDNVANFINGVAFEYGSYIWAAADDLAAFYANFPNAELGIIGNSTVWWDRSSYPNFSINDIPHGITEQPAGWYIGFSSKASQDQIKAAWMYLEWINQQDVLDYIQFGQKDINHTINADGKRQLIPMANQPVEFRMINGNQNKDYWSVAEEAYNLPIEELISQQMENLRNAKLPQDFYMDLIDVTKIGRANVDAGIRYPDPIFSEPVQSIGRYEGILEALFIEAATALVKCPPNQFDALYERYKREYLAAGYQEIMNERLALYRAGKSTQLPPAARGDIPFTVINDFMDLMSKDYMIHP